jgi:hypothetical protein
MYGNIDSGGKGALSAAQDDHADVLSLPELLQRSRYRVHHREVEDIQGWMGKGNPSHRSLEIER